MEITEAFSLLVLQGKPLAYDTPVPCFMVLSALMDMERKGELSLTEGYLEVKGSPASLSHRILTDIINGGADTLERLINHMVRGLTYSDLKNFTEATADEMCKADSRLTKHKGFISTDEVYLREVYTSFVKGLSQDNSTGDSISIAALLYGCRKLKPCLEKGEYRSVLSLIKSGYEISDLALTCYIINNIDLIRGHIMGIVAN